MFGSSKIKEAKNAYTNYVTLREYAESKNTKLRATVAVHPNLQSYVQEKMVNDKSEKVRAALASNPKLSLKAWKALKEDLSALVQAVLAEHYPEAPEKRDARKH